MAKLHCCHETSIKDNPCMLVFMSTSSNMTQPGHQWTLSLHLVHFWLTCCCVNFEQPALLKPLRSLSLQAGKGQASLVHVHLELNWLYKVTKGQICALHACTLVGCGGGRAAILWTRSAGRGNLLVILQMRAGNSHG